MPPPPAYDRWLVIRRQLTALSLFLLLAGLVLAVLYWRDRRREWPLRLEQATYRLDIGYEVLVRQLDRVQSNLLYLASRPLIRDRESVSATSRRRIEDEFAQFLQYHDGYRQIRLVDRDGIEQVRVDASASAIERIPAEQLQDKSSRYYVRQALSLQPGEVLVSEFDLNLERGRIEEPLNPVIRVVTPIATKSGEAGLLLVINFSGRPLLDELRSISVPGATLLVRADGHYILGPGASDAWGWLLGHQRTFANQFPDAWQQKDLANQQLILTDSGAFAMRSIHLRPFDHPTPLRDPLYLVSWLPRDQVFESSNQVLGRLLLLLGLLLVPLFLLTRFWASAVVRRDMQNRRIAESEQKLRELSSRLIRIQEEERRAISREIHDQWGQQVTAINLDLKLLSREGVTEAQQAGLQRAIRDSERLLESLHQIASRIRPSELDDLGLADAIESQLWEFQQRSGIVSQLESHIHQVELPPVVSENVFRLVQESLTNVLKHAAASEVRVGLELTAEDQPSPGLRVTVADNGRPIRDAGSGESTGTPRLGILGMQERVDLLGGSLDIDFDRNRGTTVTATIPLTDETLPGDREASK